MKKIFLFIFIFLFSLQTTVAKDYTLNFNGEKFHLLYSAKNKDFGGYINEYFKQKETYNTWSEMIAVHHFPNAYSPIDRIKDFKDYLSSMQVPSSLTFDDKKNTAMIDFIMIANSRMPIVMEFNIFKYEKSKKCGSIAVQYAKRYSATTTLQIEQIKADFEKNRKHLIKQVEKLNIPEIIDQDIDKCISSVELKNETDKEIQIEKEKLAEKEKEKEITNSENSTEDLSEDPVDKNGKSAKDIPVESSENSITEETDIQENNATKDAQSEQKLTENKTESDAAEIEPKSKTETKAENIGQNENKVLIEQKAAPVPDTKEVEKSANNKNDKKTKVKNKKIKEVSYEVSNTKNNIIAEPRTKKELKEEVKNNKIKHKQAIKEAKIRAKVEKKNQIKNDKLAKKQAKIDKKNKKIEEKMAKIPYEISNTNNELIAKPRTKADFKKQNKNLKKQAKQRAKEAKKKLAE